MNKKGFTLIELLAVLSLISVILIVAVPGIISIGNKMKSKATNEKTEMLKKAATSYMLKHKNYCIKNNTADSSSSYYECKIKAGELVDLGGYEKEYDSHNDCKVYNPDDYSCLDDLELSVRLKKASEKATDTLQKLATNPPTPKEDDYCTHTLEYDGTVDNNLRFTGDMPCNFVLFNNERPELLEKYRIVNISGNFIAYTTLHDTLEDCKSLWSFDEGFNSNPDYECRKIKEGYGGWRIIGVMNNIDDGTGKKETRLKIVRGDSLNNTTYSWDSSDSSINSGYGISEWNQADLMRELNEDYLNTSLTANIMWYSGNNNVKNAEFNYKEVLNQESQNLIGDAKWMLGAQNFSGTGNIPGTASEFYDAERSSTPWGLPSDRCNDGYCPRQSSWTGKVGLIYPSDFGFAPEYNRDYCLDLNLSDYMYGRQECGIVNWFSRLARGGNLHTLTSTTYFNNTLGNSIVKMGFAGTHTERPGQGLYVTPTVYLKADVKIVGGSGTPLDPYIVQ